MQVCVSPQLQCSDAVGLYLSFLTSRVCQPIFVRACFTDAFLGFGCYFLATTCHACVTVLNPICCSSSNAGPAEAPAACCMFPSLLAPSASHISCDEITVSKNAAEHAKHADANL